MIRRIWKWQDRVFWVMFVLVQPLVSIVTAIGGDYDRAIFGMLLGLYYFAVVGAKSPDAEEKEAQQHSGPAEPIRVNIPPESVFAVDPCNRCRYVGSAIHLFRCVACRDEKTHGVEFHLFEERRP